MISLFRFLVVWKWEGPETEIQKRRRRNTLVEINISSVQLRPVVRKMLRDVIKAFDKELKEFEKRVLQNEVNIKIN